MTWGAFATRTGATISLFLWKDVYQTFAAHNTESQSLEMQYSCCLDSDSSTLKSDF